MCLARVRRRKWESFSRSDNRSTPLLTDRSFPTASPATPLLVYDSAPDRGFPPRYDAAWSNFYTRYARNPAANNNYVPDYVAQMYRAVPGVGRVGWGPGIDRSIGFAPLPPAPAAEREKWSRRDESYLVEERHFLKAGSSRPQ